jgi:phasin family protein
MTSLPEQLSAARKDQLEAQLDFMRAVTAQAFESAGQVLALNINTSRASVERSANTVRQLLAATDPRDLFAIGAQGQEQLQTMMDYGRQLLGIASGARMNLSRQAAASMPAPQPEQESPAHAPAAADAAPAAKVETEAPAAKTVQPSKRPIVVAEPEQAVNRPAKAKPIASAAGKVAARFPAVEHPSASPVPAAATVEMPSIDPVEAAPPAPQVSGKPAVQAKQAQRAAARASRKK